MTAKPTETVARTRSADLRPDLLALDEQVRAALTSGGSDGLDVLGFGEVSLVVGLSQDGHRYACKRLPPMDSVRVFDRYVATLQDYIALLSRTLTVQQTWTWHRTNEKDVTAYCVQEELPAERLLPTLMRARSEAYAAQTIERLVDAIRRTITPTLGLDAQVSNWADLDGDLVYLDVTTPLLKDSDGREQTDMGLFCASLPAPLRLPARAGVVPRIIRKYYEPRGAVLDLLGNLYKEGLGGHVPTLVRVANAHVSPRLSEEEVRAYYAEDARTWAVLQALRRMDRAWTRRVLRRQYPFLLPEDIQR